MMPTATREGRWVGETVLRSARGRDVPLSGGRARHEGAGRRRFSSIATIARDISEAKKVARMKNEFVSTVSHELRTPLTSIRGALGLLEGGVMGKLDDAVLEIIHIARTNSDRLVRLINDMLDLDKIEAGTLEMTLREVGAEELAASAIDSVRGMAEQAGVTLRSSIEPSLRLIVDLDRTVQVLTNLISNAVKFSPRDTAVLLRVAGRGEVVRFEVIDRGPGIPEELRARLFQKFQQLDASDARAKGERGSASADFEGDRRAAPREDRRRVRRAGRGRPSGFPS